MKKTHKSVKLLVQELLSQAIENEPTITSDLQTITYELSAELVGLEHKFKSKKYIERKILDAVKINSLEIAKVSDRINDVLRYTMIFSTEDYADGYRKTIELLWENGYFIPEKRIWNAWDNIGTLFDKGYRGINITVISSQRQIFELQFHTVESFHLKNETHHLYKEMRDRNISQKERVKLVKLMKAKAAKVKWPKGI